MTVELSCDKTWFINRNYSFFTTQVTWYGSSAEKLEMYNNCSFEGWDRHFLCKSDRTNCDASDNVCPDLQN